jgi:acid phosphatase type 7
MRATSAALLFVTSSSVGEVMGTSSTPEQIHLALAGQDGARVTWFTKDDLTAPGCIYGASAETLTSTTQGLISLFYYLFELLLATSQTYLPSYGAHHKARLSDLSQGSEYFYSCGDLNAEMSEVFSFRTPPKVDNLEPLRFAIFGDMVRRPFPFLFFSFC